MKNLIIAAIVGTAFMAGGFYFGMRMMPAPPAKAVAAGATAPGQVAPAAAPLPEPISIDTLKKTSETMMSLNQALQAREQAVAAREHKVTDREAELSAEREALDRTHDQFKSLFNQFQDRLQLVDASQQEQLQKQADLYTAMGTEQSIDLIRVMDDSAMSRLFSVMETKPLAKLMADWKAKYPKDAPRLISALNGMAEVLPKEKLAISDPTPAPAAPVPDSAPAPAAAPSTDSTTPSAPVAPSDSNASATPVTTPDATPSLAPPADPTSNPAPALPTPPDTNKAPVSTATTN